MGSNAPSRVCWEGEQLNKRDGATPEGAATPPGATARRESLRLAEAPCCDHSGAKATQECKAWKPSDADNA